MASGDDGSVFWKVVTQMMINDKGSCLHRVQDGWCGSAALVGNDDVLRVLRLHSFSLDFVMNSGILANQVNINQVRGVSQCHKSPLQYHTGVETVGILVRYNQCLGSCCSAARVRLR